MSKQWTKSEEAVLTDYMGTRRVLYWRDKLAIHNLLPNRSPAAIEKRWGIMLGRRNRKPVRESLFNYDAVAEYDPRTPPLPNPPMLKYSDIAGLCKITEQPRNPIEHAKSILRAAGLRGRVTIELGE